MNKLPFELNLNGKTIVITGGGGVLCREFATALGKTGANIAVLDINFQAAEDTANIIIKNGGTAKAYRANVLSSDEMKLVRESVHADFGLCDILINGAGGNNPKGTTTKEYYEEGDIDCADEIKTFFDLDPDGVSFVFNLNFLGTLIPTQVFAEDMIGNKSGNIINISSMNAFTPLTKIPAYSGAKAAVSNFTQWLAVHFSKVGIRVNAIAPGFFVTDQNKDLLFDKNNNPTDRTKKILAATPLNRFGEAKELIGTLLWLLNDDASGFVDGVVIPIDGGFSAYSGV